MSSFCNLVNLFDLIYSLEGKNLRFNQHHKFIFSAEILLLLQRPPIWKASSNN